ncbi:MAG: AMP-binding protein [bacterium]|nr:AMP-binding protein [bacterium]
MNKLLNHKNINSFYQFTELFEKYGDIEALWTSDLAIKLSYKDLARAIQSFSYLLSKKIKPGQRVVLLDLHGPHWVIAFFSVILNKAIAVPIDQRMDRKLQEEIVKMVDASLLITCNSKLEHKIKSVIYEEAKLLDRKWLSELIDQNIPAEIIFTSGTWGKPKGVVLTHKNILSNLNSIMQVYQPKKEEKLLSVLPLSHAYEQMCGLLIPIASGCHIIYQDSLDSFSLLESLQKFKVNYMVVVPKFLELLQASILRNLGKSKILFYPLLKTSQYLPISKRRVVFHSLHKKFGNNLKTFIVGGAPLSNNLEDFFKRLGFNSIVGYGLSESSPVLSFSQENKRPVNSVGYPIPQVKINIADDDEIIASGPNVSPGYWPLNNLTQQKILNTGDIGYLDQRGRLYITGRKKNMVVFSTGDKIQLEDIEATAAQFDGVLEVCAISIGENNPELILVYTGTAQEQKILEFLNSKLPLYARIKKVTKWHNPTLPSSHTLKIKRDIIMSTYER